MSRPRFSAIAAAVLVGLLTTSCSSSASACDKMREAQDELADLQRRIEDGGRFPENSPGEGEIKDAYYKVAQATDDCTDEIVRRRGQ